MDMEVGILEILAAIGVLIVGVVTALALMHEGATNGIDDSYGRTDSCGIADPMQFALEILSLKMVTVRIGTGRQVARSFFIAGSLRGQNPRSSTTLWRH